ncbi:efflux RND transporter periplasmic adaptor subunit [Fundidesulfovibrio putealis]|uniref:efflux RND transporter periplasmic adaptor subunit n=1 Tax=Fundidesulfovibrio putealis TaxID=270496 RepID=UPI00146FB37A|nr:efflux RND transporter periplasmic adaptor subunit [Fundidesulfovibrio putealis]
MKIVFIVVMAAILLLGCEKKKDAPPVRPVPVRVVKAEQRDAPITVSGVGNVVAARTVAVQPQVTGKLQSLHFLEGALVREGQLLARLDMQPFEARLSEARGALNRDWAKAGQAGRDYLRYKDLIRQQVVSQDEYEQRRTDFESGWQQVKADQGAVETARINLEYCTILSPVTGVTGYQQVKPGNTVSAYQSTLVTINQVQPVLVRFSVSEAELALVRRYYGKETIQTTVRVPKEEQDLKERGTLTAIDNAVDPQTGMIMLQAQFGNQSLGLWPGQFVNVVATLAVDKGRTVIPYDAVMTRQDGSFVFVVTDKSTAELRKVVTGRNVGKKDVVVLEGLSPGETVIIDGIIQVAPGGPVTIRQEQSQPEPAAAPEQGASGKPQ